MKTVMNHHAWLRISLAAALLGTLMCAAAAEPASEAPAATAAVQPAAAPDRNADETAAGPTEAAQPARPAQLRRTLTPRTAQTPLPVLPAPANVPTIQSVPPGPAVPLANRVAAGDQAARPLSLDVNKSRLVRLARPARDVLVANPAVADIVLRSADTAFVIGRKVGETNVYFFDAEGRQIDELDLTVAFDSTAVTAVLRRMIPDERIEVTTANQSLVLSGSVASQIVSENARQIARQFVADDNSIINLLNIRDKNQVLLRVRVSEMARQVVKELGITPGSPAFNAHIGGTRLNVSGTLPSTVSPAFNSLNAFIPLGGATTLTALLQALESNGLVKTLAEPNLTAVSGETASFLVGGEFPVPSPQPSSVPGAGSTITVVYKDFGVRLTFTPVILSGGLINLRIATEVSQLSTQGQITANGFTIPALSVRRAETTVELPSGGSIAIAGLLQNDIQNTIQGFPILKDIPVLGSLFASTQFQRNESDLVIAVTPLLVRPVDANALALPTDGFGPANDFNMYLLGRLNATYAKPTPDQPFGRPRGPYGYIVD
jgi:pilus assembly protein CpaC